MIVSTNLLRWAALLPLLALQVNAAPNIAPDTPFAQLLSLAADARRSGSLIDALTYYDAAITKDPSNPLTFFQRGAIYLQLGRNGPATSDFDSVLNLKPDHSGALTQRGKIKARNADWPGAKDDYNKAGKGGTEEMTDLVEAEVAAGRATEAENKSDWEHCVSQSGVAIRIASTYLPLRQQRARCRFERGEIQEAVHDLAHVLQISPGQIEPHLQISSMLFYSLGDTARGIQQVKKCLHSDPDSKLCKRLHRREKALLKTIEKVRNLMESRQYNSASKLLVGTGKEEDSSLLQDIKDDTISAREAGTIHPNAPNNLYADMIERTCECFREMNSPRKGKPYCTEALELNPTSLHGLLHKSQTQLDAEEYEPALNTLNTAKEHQPAAQNIINQKVNEAHTLLKRSKSKDYYKILNVDRSSDDRTIKKAYRTLTKIHHPDKAQARGLTKEEAEKKMAGINEAYEVLSDPELKARFDRGEDPNDPMAQQGGNPFQGSPFGFQQGGQPIFFQQGSGGGRQQFKFQAGGGGNPFQGFPGFG